MSKLRVILLTVSLAGCGKSRSGAPIDCMSKGLERFTDKLTHAQLAHLCSHTDDATAPLDCFEKARATTELNMSVSGALELCSPYNLDASNAAKAAERAADKDCPAVDLSTLERRLRDLEDKLDALKRR